MVRHTTLALQLGLLLSWIPYISAQSVDPTSATIDPAAPLQIAYNSSKSVLNGVAKVQPLTSQAGLNRATTELSLISISGTVQLVDPHDPKGVSSLTSSSIAYISCDNNANVSNISPTDLVKSVSALEPHVKAILLFSSTGSHCNLTGDFGYYSIFSMVTISDGQMLKAVLSRDGVTNGNITIAGADLGSNGGTGNSSPTGGANSTPSGGANNQVAAPTTAVAMSILYSITGIITLLFLVIIATGAVRAHRHPERYGPRNGFPGRPRQSRAKGLARAMLETLPIVKFGDPEPTKPTSPDVELEEGRNRNLSLAATDVPASDEGTEAVTGTTEHAEGDSDKSAIGANTATTNSKPRSTSDEEQGPAHLGCSICTEDFERGEDVRVLPCNHKYHPACIDPWLLNVSGTCPLCRIDLRPVETRASADVAEETNEVAPPLAEIDPTTAPAGTASATATASTPHAGPPFRGRVGRTIDRALLRNSSVAQRIAMANELRAEASREAGAGATPVAGLDPVAERSRRASLTARLRSTFRVRTRAASEVVPPPVVGARRLSVTPGMRRGSVEHTLYGDFDGQNLYVRRPSAALTVVRDSTGEARRASQASASASASASPPALSTVVGDRSHRRSSVISSTLGAALASPGAVAAQAAERRVSVAGASAGAGEGAQAGEGRRASRLSWANPVGWPRGYMGRMG